MNLRGLFEHADNIREYRAGTTLFKEGTPGDEMYIILDGDVELSIGDKILAVVGAGDIVGEMALIDLRARSATAVAKTDCRVVPVNENRFLLLVQQTPFFSLHVMRVLAERLRQMDARQGSK
ncbi:MAG: cyclic nucleotide-binding domain-containing protein [Candidatus Kryptoniota bacterium]